MGRPTKQNRLTDSERLSKVNPENRALLKSFIEYLHSIGRSEGTRCSYKGDLEIFFVWVLENAGNKEFARISKRDIISFQNWLLNTNGNSPARIRRVKASISSLSNYVENILDDDPDYKGFRSIVNKVESPAMKRVKKKTVLTDESVRLLLDTLRQEGHIEQCCTAALALYSGRRKSELSRFRVSDFDDAHLVCGGALWKSEPIKTKGRSDGKYIPCYTLVKDFKPYLDEWLAYREEHGIKSEWLIPEPINGVGQITISTLNSWARHFSCVLNENFYWHACRHYFTTKLAQAGIPDSIIVEIVGWESTDMVRVYNDTDADAQISAYFKDGEIAVKANEFL